MSAVELIIQHEGAFALVLTRVGAMLAAIPVIGGRGVPPLVRALAAVALAIALLPLVPVVPPPDPIGLAVGFAGEIAIGALIGLAVRMVFAAIELGAEFAGLQMGFGIANVFDPASNQQISLLGQLHGVVALLVFFAMDGHTVLLRGLAYSFEVIPPLAAHVSGSTAEILVRLGGGMFALALAVAIPVTAALVLTNLTMGLLGRVVPQMNVLLLSFPVTISVGLLVMGASLSLFVATVGQRVDGIGQTTMGLVGSMRANTGP